MEGKILFVELEGCSFKQANSEKRVREALEEIAKACDVTVLRTVSYKFAPQGVTAVSIIAESHIGIHTWPEKGYISIMIYTCGETDPEAAIPAIKRMFRHSDIKYMRVPEK